MRFGQRTEREVFALIDGTRSQIWPTVTRSVEVPWSSFRETCRCQVRGFNGEVAVRNPYELCKTCVHDTYDWWVIATWQRSDRLLGRGCRGRGVSEETMLAGNGEGRLACAVFSHNRTLRHLE